MKIIVDQNIRAAGGTFGRNGELIVVDGRNIRASQLVDADALIIRTTTRVDRQLLKDSAVRFVGTTSAGTDHLDIDWLEQQGITWASAPGCNADSAAQYTLAMMWLACERQGLKLADQRVGIIGRGNVGSRVQRLLAGLGVETVANDPPLADRGEPGLVSLDEALTQDIVSLHVPLNRSGVHPTYRFIAAEQLARVSDQALLVNTARGGVVDGNALMLELGNDRIYAALDVCLLPLMHRQLNTQLKNLGRDGWLAEDCSRSLNKAQTPPNPEQSWKRINGHGRLDGVSLAILQLLATWRDKQAERRNLARGFVIKDAALLTIAKRQPGNLDALSELDIWHPKAVQRHGPSMVDTIAKVLQEGSIAEQPEVLQPEHRDLLADMRNLVQERSTELSVEPALLASKRELEALILSPVDLPLSARFMGWRKDIITNDLLALKEAFS